MILSDDHLARLSRQGFRRWYERQLIESHLWLAACFVCMIVVAAGFELLSERRGTGEFLVNALIIGGGCVACWFSWRCYSSTMIAAEAISVQAVCPDCRHFGFRLKAELARGQDPRVTCPKCSRQWTLQR